jgi:peptide/nickel transport system permease protein
VAIVENPVMQQPASPVDADPIGTIANATRRFPAPAVAVGAVGLVVLLVSMFVIRDMATVPRSFIALVGGLGFWFGVQKLGAWKFGPNFSLGLVLSFAYLTVVGFVTIFAGLLPIEKFENNILPTVLEERRMRPGLRLDEPLGRDMLGGSLTTQVFYAGRVSLTIVLLAVVFGLVFGCLVGLVAGYFGKWVDSLVSVFVNSALAFPPLILLIVIVSVYNPTVWSIGLALAVVSIPTYSRIMRAQTMMFREREFVTAARAMGASGRRIMFRDILPNAMLPVLSYMFINGAVVIIAEGSLAYLGLSVPFPKPTWGALIASGQDRLRSDPHIVFVPAAVMFLTVLSLNRIGDWARKKVMGERNLLK